MIKLASKFNKFVLIQCCCPRVGSSYNEFVGVELGMKSSDVQFKKERNYGASFCFLYKYLRGCTCMYANACERIIIHNIKLYISYIQKFKNFDDQNKSFECITN